MTPEEALNKLPAPSKAIVYGGLAVIAAASFAANWVADWSSALKFGGLIIILGVVLALVSFIAGDPTLKRVLGWFLTLFIVLISMTFFFSAVTRGRGFVPEPWCLLNFSREPCNAPGGAADLAAERNSTPVTTPKNVQPPPPGQFKPADYEVVVQFAGVITRESVRNMMSKLAQAGWRVPDAQRGGERTTTAIGYNEIRYRTQADKPAALALAAAVQNANLTPTAIAVRENAKDVDPKRLEVWLSH